MQTVHVAVAVIENAQGDILVAKRPDHLHMGGLWEFPGGKLEPGETVLHALQREVREELALEVMDAKPFLKIPYQYPDKRVLLDVWRVFDFTGEPRGCEGQAIQWVKKNKLHQYEFPAANRHILTALTLSERMLITGSFIDATDCLRRIERANTLHGIRTVQLRAHHLARNEYAALVQDVLPLCKARDITLLLNTSVDGFEKGANGLHLSSRQLFEQAARPVAADILLGASCHNAAEIWHAQKIGVDYISLSPVMATASHSDQKSLGWDGFAVLAAACPMPVFALGGLGDADINKAKVVGGFGIAAISAWW